MRPAFPRGVCQPDLGALRGGLRLLLDRQVAPLVAQRIRSTNIDLTPWGWQAYGPPGPSSGIDFYAWDPPDAGITLDDTYLGGGTQTTARASAQAQDISARPRKGATLTRQTPAAPRPGRTPPPEKGQADSRRARRSAG